MLVFLPLLALIILGLISHFYHEDWRSSILASAISWGVFISLFTEGLSLFKAINFVSVLTGWIILIGVLGWFYYRLLKNKPSPFKLFTIPRLTPVIWVGLGGIIFFVTIVGLIAIGSPPNNWDSMTYHMPRVVHWIQNKSLAHYPTYFSAQLIYPPFPGIVIMHSHILSGGDRFASLGQWFAMVGSIIGVSLIAKQLGADRKGQILASIFCCTIPMGILQASSTQNDYIVSFWLVCLAYYVLLLLSSQKYSNYLVLAIGCSLGLALFTKSSGYLYSFPFMVGLFLGKVKSVKWKIFKSFGLITVCFILLNINHYLRNINLYGNPIPGAEYRQEYSVEVYSFPTLISNLVRNVSLHADIIRYLGLEKIITPITGIVHKIVIIIHQFLGVDVNDSRITYPPNSYSVPGISFDENIAGNPLHFILIIFSIVIFCLFFKSFKKSGLILSYLLMLFSGFFLLCLMLKLQPYQSRHHLALFVLFSSFVGLVFSIKFNKYLVFALAIFLLTTSMPWVFKNNFRPILAEKNIFNLHRNELYFTHRPHLKQSYFDAVNFIEKNKCQNIALSLGWEDTPSGTYWEYPFWALLRNNLSKKFQLNHIVHPENYSYPMTKTEEYNNFNPCAIIAIREKQEQVKTMAFNRKNYSQVFVADSINILIPNKP